MNKSNSGVLSIFHVNKSVLEAEFSSGWVATDTNVDNSNQEQESCSKQSPSSYDIRVFVDGIVDFAVAVSCRSSLVDV